ncbi:CRISPR-associated endoribonuclease Cas6 [Candidatus Woesearchaeota archaeon]|nr:CRISPR-associated endoribonuclease Cas6 [Candidatus Woesearchaeota archaeon]
MRLLLKLRAEKDFSYDKKYFHKLRGFLYSLLDGTEYNPHNNESYKHFCFSNVFPVKDFKKGDIRNLLISSPDKNFLRFLCGRLYEIKQFKEDICIGEYFFRLAAVNYVKTFIDSSVELITGTPIVIRIPKYNYKKYGIKSKRPYEYWRKEYDFTAFIKQLTENLIKKYNDIYDENIKDINLFQEFIFKKEVCVHRIENGKEVKTVGSLWKFKFDHLDKLHRKILWVGLESGFGGLNSSGFGFMNEVEK